MKVEIDMFGNAHSQFKKEPAKVLKIPSSSIRESGKTKSVKFRYCGSCGLDMLTLLHIFYRIYKRIRIWENMKANFSFNMISHLSEWERIDGTMVYVSKCVSVSEYCHIASRYISEADEAVREMVLLHRHFRKFGLQWSFPIRSIVNSRRAVRLFTEHNTCMVCGKPGQGDLFAGAR